MLVVGEAACMVSRSPIDAVVEDPSGLSAVLPVEDVVPEVVFPGLHLSSEVRLDLVDSGERFDPLGSKLESFIETIDDKALRLIISEDDVVIWPDSEFLPLELFVFRHSDSVPTTLAGYTNGGEVIVEVGF